MELQYKPYQLEFKHPFGVSSNTRKTTSSIFVKITNGPYTGYGEACLPPYLGENEAETIRFLESSVPLLAAYNGDFSITAILEKIDQLDPGCNAAKAAIDIALHDLKGRMTGKPVYALLGLPKSEPRATAFTIGIDNEARLGQKIIEASDFSILKIKAGTADDQRLIRQIRKFTYKPLYVDVNQGWKDWHLVINMLNWMKEQGVVLVEQPMPVRMKEEMRRVKKLSPLPLFADESVKRLNDLESVADQFHGINIKLMKSTGIAEALAMIRGARELGLRVFLGCMAESSCATVAMAHLMGLADHLDLDAPNLYTNDPFRGPGYKDGKVLLSDEPGLGIRLVKDIF